MMHRKICYYTGRKNKGTVRLLSIAKSNLCSANKAAQRKKPVSHKPLASCLYGPYAYLNAGVLPVLSLPPKRSDTYDATFTHDATLFHVLHNVKQYSSKPCFIILFVHVTMQKEEVRKICLFIATISACIGWGSPIRLPHHKCRLIVT